MARRWVTVDTVNPVLPAVVLGATMASSTETIAGVSTSKAITPAGLAATTSHADVRNYGAVGDGVTNNHAALVTATTNPTRTLLFPNQTFLDSSSVLNINNSITIEAESGAVFRKTHSGTGIQIMPAAVSAGVASADRAVGDTTVTVTGAGWAVDGHVGKWVLMANAFPQSRKVVSNTSDTLTLDYPLGGPITAGAALTFYTPLDSVEINNLTIDGTGAGAANLVIQYVNRLRIRNLTSNDSVGNGLSVYYSEDVIIEDYHCDGGFFGAFIYACRRGKIIRPYVRGWSNEYGVQLKDCIGFDIIDGDVDPESGGGDTGMEIKASGLHPSNACRIINGRASGCGAYGLSMLASANEGTGYAAENFEIVGGQCRDCVTDWGVVASGGGSFRNGKVTGVQGLDATFGSWTINNADNIEVRDIYTEGCGARSSVTDASGCVIEGTMKNTNMNGTSDEAIRLDNANNTRVNVKFIHTLSGSTMIRAVRELNGCTNNEIRREIHDTGGTALTTDVLLEASSGSTVWRRLGNDEVNASTSIVGAVETPMAVYAALNAQSGTTYTFAMSDLGKLVTLNNASAIAVTMPTNATVPFPLGTVLHAIGIGVGVVTISGAGTTLLGTLTGPRYSQIRATKIGTDTWVCGLDVGTA